MSLNSVLNGERELMALRLVQAKAHELSPRQGK